MSGSELDEHPLILVVDDDWLNRELLEGALTVAGMQVKLAASAEAALDLLADLRPQVIVADVRMPGKDGYALAREVRSRPVLQGVRLVLMTALDIGAVQQIAARESGADAILSRARAVEDLPPLIWRLLGQAGGAATLAPDA